MGKRKKGKKLTVQKRVYKIPKLFSCPYCFQQDGIKITFDKRKGSASLLCRKCDNAEYEMPLTALTEPVDVYDAWMDVVRESNAKFNPDIKSLEEREREKLAQQRAEEIEYEGRLTRAKTPSEDDETLSEDGLEDDSDQA
jgi:transcription elongation factor Elf1